MLEPTYLAYAKSSSDESSSKKSGNTKHAPKDSFDMSDLIRQCSNNSDDARFLKKGGRYHIAPREERMLTEIDELTDDPSILD